MKGLFHKKEKLSSANNYELRLYIEENKTVSLLDEIIDNIYLIGEYIVQSE